MQHAKTETAEKTGRVLDGDDRAADRAGVLGVPVVSEKDRVAARAGVLGVPVASEENKVEDRVEVSEAPAASEEDMVMDRVEVSEVPVVSGGDNVVIPVLVPVLASYRTDSTENRAAGMVLAEVLAASAVGPACAYDHRRYPA